MVLEIRVEGLVPSMNFHYLMITESMMSLEHWIVDDILGKGLEALFDVILLFCSLIQKKKKEIRLEIINKFFILLSISGLSRGLNTGRAHSQLILYETARKRFLKKIDLRGFHFVTTIY